MDYKARMYDPALKRFLQPDSIIPGVGNPQSWNRYSYVLNRPIVFNDPSGHRVCGLSGSGVCENDEELMEYADQTLRDYGKRNDLEAVARIVDKAAKIYRNYNTMIPALSMVFLGIKESTPLTLYRAGFVANPCASVGRTDCGANGNYVFLDEGFHADFQDNHSQPFHYWAYVATAASTDVPLGGYAPGFVIGHFGNVVHENLGVGDPAGASWQDFALAQAGINTGELIALGVIPPNELGKYIRENIGNNSSGAFYVNFMVNFWPLQGNLR